MHPVLHEYANKGQWQGTEHGQSMLAVTATQ